MTVTREQAADMAEAHDDGLHEGLPREGCPECERRDLRDYPPATKAETEVELHVGDVFWTKVAPFEAEVYVIEVTEVGAVLEYTGRTRLVGYPQVLRSPGGHPLTTEPMQDFVGRAHWPTVKIEGKEDGHDQAGS